MRKLLLALCFVVSLVSIGHCVTWYNVEQIANYEYDPVTHSIKVSPSSTSVFNVSGSTISISNFIELINSQFGLARSTDIAALIAEIRDHYYNPSATMTVVNPFIPFNPASTVTFTNTNIDVSESKVYVDTINVNNIDKCNTKDVVITSGNITVVNLPAELPINSQSSVTVVNLPAELPINSQSSVTVTNMVTVPTEIAINSQSSVTVVNLPAELPINSQSSVTVVNLPAELPINSQSSVTVVNIDKCNTKDVVITSGVLTLSGTTNITGSTVTIASAYISSGVAGKLTGVTNFTITPADYLFDISFLMKNSADPTQYVTISCNWRGQLPPICDGDSTGDIKCVNPVYGAVFTGSCPVTSTITWNATTGAK